MSQGAANYWEEKVHQKSKMKALHQTIEQLKMELTAAHTYQDTYKNANKDLHDLFDLKNEELAAEKEKVKVKDAAIIYDEKQYVALLLLNQQTQANWEQSQFQLAATEKKLAAEKLKLDAKEGQLEILEQHYQPQSELLKSRDAKILALLEENKNLKKAVKMAWGKKSPGKGKKTSKKIAPPAYPLMYVLNPKTVWAQKTRQFAKVALAHTNKSDIYGHFNVPATLANIATLSYQFCEGQMTLDCFVTKVIGHTTIGLQIIQKAVDQAAS